MQYNLKNHFFKSKKEDIGKYFHKVFVSEEKDLFSAKNIENRPAAAIIYKEFAAEPFGIRIKIDIPDEPLYSEVHSRPDFPD